MLPHNIHMRMYTNCISNSLCPCESQYNKSFSFNRTRTHTFHCAVNLLLNRMNEMLTLFHLPTHKYKTSLNLLNTMGKRNKTNGNSEFKKKQQQELKTKWKEEERKKQQTHRATIASSQDTLLMYLFTPCKNNAYHVDRKIMTIVHQIKWHISFTVIIQWNIRQQS